MDNDQPRFRGKMKIKRCWKCPFIGRKIGVYLSLCNYPANEIVGLRLEVRHGSDDPIPDECPLSKVPHDLKKRT